MELILVCDSMVLNYTQTELKNTGAKLNTKTLAAISGAKHTSI